MALGVDDQYVAGVLCQLVGYENTVVVTGSSGRNPLCADGGGVPGLLDGVVTIRGRGYGTGRELLVVGVWRLYLSQLFS